MRVVDPNEGLLVKAFMKGLRESSFGESLYRIPPKTLMEISQRAAVEIEIEEAMRHKKAGDKRTLAHTKGEQDIKTFRRERTPPRTRMDRHFVPYIAQQRTEYRRIRKIPGFRLAPTEILEDAKIFKHLRYPNITGRTLGSKPDAWCKFHQAGGHDTNSCYSLNNQLSTLANRGLMGKYMKSDTDVDPSRTRPVPDLHETPVLGDFNTIAGGFAGGGQTCSARKRYVRSVMTMAKIERPKKVLAIVFSSEDLKGVVPHEDDPIVLSLIMMGRNVHRVLVDQWSSADVMFWNTYTGLQISTDQLRPFDEVLVGFSGDQVEVKGYVDLRTTFRDKENAKTIFIRYIVVNAQISLDLRNNHPPCEISGENREKWVGWLAKDLEVR